MICECNFDGYLVEWKDGMYWCLKCQRIKPAFMVNKMPEKKEYIPCVLPTWYCLSPEEWERKSPWRYLGFDCAMENGFYESKCEHGLRCIVMPILDNFGKTVYYSARVIGGSDWGHKYCYPKNVQKQYWRNHKKSQDVIMCEGVADAVRLDWVFPLCGVIALLGTAYDGSLDAELAGKNAYLAFDNDVAGHVASVKIGTALSEICDVSILQLPADPTDLTDDELRGILVL